MPACLWACAVIVTVSVLFSASPGAAALPLAASVAAGSLAVQRALPKPPRAATIAPAAAPPRRGLSFIIDHLRKSWGTALWAGRAWPVGREYRKRVVWGRGG